MTSGPKSFPLFREEAMRHRTDHVFGSTLVMATPVWTWATITTLALLLAIVAALVFGTYGRRIEAVGALVYSTGVARVTAPKAGVVSSIQVQEGELVVAGQTMLVLSTVRSSTSDADIESSVAALLREERANIVRQLAAEEALSRTSRMRGEQDRRAASETIESLQGSRALSLQRLTLAEAEHRRTVDLVNRQLLAKAALDKAEDAVVVARLAVQQIDQQLGDERRHLNGLSADGETLPLLLAKRQSELKAALSGIDQRLTEAENSKDAVVSAPVSGRVTGIAVNLGESVSPGTSLLVVAPEAAALQAELLVPARSAGFLRNEMEVRLSYDAFPYQKFGQYRGRVVAVGRNVLSPDDQKGPIRLNEPAFRVLVAVDKQEINLRGQSYPLRAGLTLRALLMQGDRRRLIEWLLDPLYTLSGAM